MNYWMLSARWPRRRIPETWGDDLPSRSREDPRISGMNLVKIGRARHNMALSAGVIRAEGPPFPVMGYCQDWVSHAVSDG